MLKAKKKERTIKISEIVAEVKNVETWINGHLETTNKAQIGDYIVIGSQGETYVITPENMEKRYIISENGETATTKPVKIDFEYAQNDIEFTASWGSPMTMKAGDVLIYENNKLSYGIALNAFNDTYEVLQ